MSYVRPHESDFEEWNAKYGIANWTLEDLLPYFRKSEGFLDDLDDSTNTSYHWRGGPLPVGYEKFNPVFTTAFLESALLSGYSLGDFNAESQLRFSQGQSIKSAGRRVTTKRAYLDGAQSRRNLRVITFAHVTRVLFDPNHKAVGVEYFRENKLYRSFALNEIVLSAGALRTPQLLLLSGIGDPDHLNRSGIHQITSLPGVGSNLQDHVYSMIHFAVNSTDTLKPSRVNQIANYLMYRKDGTGPLTSSGECGVGFIAINQLNDTGSRADAKITCLALSPMSFQDEEFWKSAFGFRKMVWRRYFTPYEKEDTISMSIGLMRPKSRG